MNVINWQLKNSFDTKKNNDTMVKAHKKPIYFEDCGLLAQISYLSNRKYCKTKN